MGSLQELAYCCAAHLAPAELRAPGLGLRLGKEIWEGLWLGI